jgi:hypothetical protein
MSLVTLGSAVWFPASLLAQPIPVGGASSSTFVDTTWKVCDNADATKCFNVGDLTGITTGNTVAPFTVNGTAAAPGIIFDQSWGVNGAGGHLVGASGVVFGFTNAATVTSGSACDTCLQRGAANVFSLPAGDWFQQSNGRSTLAADFTSADVTMVNTALAGTLIVSRKYTFLLEMYYTNTTAADGIRIDFDGGAATATNFRAHCTSHDTALILSQQTTAIATDMVVTTATGASILSCSGSIEPSGAGTFIVRAAEEADGGGTLTVNRGSFLWIEDAP